MDNMVGVVFGLALGSILFFMVASLCDRLEI